MDRFDLKWPSTDATFYTDGWRCRIVWRQKGGIGGTIDNNAQCLRRVADSLDGAPYLLSALKARGHDRLARVAHCSAIQCGHAGEAKALYVLEGRAATRRQVADGVSQRELVDGR